jgi:hypothetical protein
MKGVLQKDGGRKMKKILTVSVLVLALSVIFSMDAGSHRRCRDYDDGTFRNKHIDLEDGTLVIEHDDEDWIVEITEDYELYVNGDRVKTDREQRKLLRSYYRDYEEIEEFAEEIGKEGAKIGLAGAKLGANAAICAAKLLLDDYDSDDMELEIEIDKEALEKMVKKIEKKADKIEDMADDFEKKHRKLRRSIPELGDLEDF